MDLPVFIFVPLCLLGMLTLLTIVCVLFSGVRGIIRRRKKKDPR